MVELLALPFFLEMLFLLVREREEGSVRKEAFVFSLTGGILFCMKMTNIVYLVPLVLLYIWKIRKDITVPLFLSCPGGRSGSGYGLSCIQYSQYGKPGFSVLQYNIPIGILSD